MFTFSHEESMEVNLSLAEAWDFFVNPINWPKLDDRYDTCVLEGELKAGSKIKAKFKDKLAQVLILVTELRPYHECKYLTKSLFFTQESFCGFQEISTGKTRITLKVYIISIFTPFMKSIF